MLRFNVTIDPDCLDYDLNNSPKFHSALMLVKRECIAKASRIRSHTFMFSEIVFEGNEICNLPQTHHYVTFRIIISIP
jgi:hypothetical protein